MKLLLPKQTSKLILSQDKIFVSQWVYLILRKWKKESKCLFWLICLDKTYLWLTEIACEFTHWLCSSNSKISWRTVLNLVQGPLRREIRLYSRLRGFLEGSKQLRKWWSQSLMPSRSTQSFLSDVFFELLFLLTLSLTLFELVPLWV